MNKTPSVLALLLATMLMVSACTSTGYALAELKQLDIAPEDMNTSVDIGSKVTIETKDFIYIITVTGYEDNRIVIGTEDFDGREVRIPVDEITKISEGDLEDIELERTQRFLTPSEFAGKVFYEGFLPVFILSVLIFIVL